MGKEAVDFWMPGTKLIPTEKTNFQKFWYGKHSSWCFADWRLYGFCQTNVYWGKRKS